MFTASIVPRSHCRTPARMKACQRWVKTGPEPESRMWKHFVLLNLSLFKFDWKLSIAAKYTLSWTLTSGVLQVVSIASACCSLYLVAPVSVVALEIHIWCLVRRLSSPLIHLLATNVSSRTTIAWVVPLLSLANNMHPLTIEPASMYDYSSMLHTAVLMILLWYIH